MLYLFGEATKAKLFVTPKKSLIRSFNNLSNVGNKPKTYRDMSKGITSLHFYHLFTFWGCWCLVGIADGAGGAFSIARNAKTQEASLEDEAYDSCFSLSGPYKIPTAC